jgi:hypothetical protein
MFTPKNQEARLTKRQRRLLGVRIVSRLVQCQARSCRARHRARPGVIEQCPECGARVRTLNEVTALPGAH